MQKFRECERETKTKAFSKEGLKQPSKQTPQDVVVSYVGYGLGKTTGSTRGFSSSD